MKQEKTDIILDRQNIFTSAVEQRYIDRETTSLYVWVGCGGTRGRWDSIHKRSKERSCESPEHPRNHQLQYVSEEWS